MTKLQMLAMIDQHKNGLMDPNEMLDWTWLRVIVLCIPDEVYDDLLDKAAEIMSR
jgi:hypothetical protein